MICHKIKFSNPSINLISCVILMAKNEFKEVENALY